MIHYLDRLRRREVARLGGEGEYRLDHGFLCGAVGEGSCLLRGVNVRTEV